jgi:penicillin-binding protein 1A
MSTPAQIFQTVHTVHTMARQAVRRRHFRLNRRTFLLCSLLLSALTGVAAGYILVHSESLPRVSALDDRFPATITRVLDRNGEKVGEFAVEKRELVTYEEIPDHLKQAVIAVEDSRFYEHPGIDPLGISRAILKNITALRLVQGGSTLTQQLAKLLFLTPERSLKRKALEAVLALRIEASYSKEEILTLYCNQVYLGHNRYGMEAASRCYFHKPVREADLAQCALLAGLPQRPNAYSPLDHPEAALKRRNHVLDRMAAERYITREEAEKEKKRPLLPSAAHEEEAPANAPYFVEEVRKLLSDRFGGGHLYRDGLAVYTTLDAGLQRAAVQALERGLRTLDKRHGWRGAPRNLLEEGLDPDRYQDATWSEPFSEGRVLQGVVQTVRPGYAILRVGRRPGRCTLQSAAWTGAGSMTALLRRGDLVSVRIQRMCTGSGPLELSLEQEPLIQGALVALDAETGEILAMVGGYSFEKSMFNCAVQAPRQPGSAFKPLYYAAAFDRGFTPADTFFDEPIAIEDPHTHRVYAPQNHSREYHGLTTLRTALEKSYNPLSVQLLESIGIDTGIAFARRLGVRGNLQPYPSLALGAFETTLLELTSAYQVFANGGIKCNPYYIKEIRDRDGYLLTENHPTSQRVIREETAFLITHVLQGVIERGTGASAAKLGLPLAGKTGTTDDYTDAWFVGYSPRIVCGVWVGYEKEKKSLGAKVTGAVAALPIWTEFMAKAVPHDSPGDFVPPANVELLAIDPATGLRATASCPSVIQEAFIRGTAPVMHCSESMHRFVSLPYDQQRLEYE